MTEYAYNNAKNVGTSYILFKFNSEYYLYIFFKKKQIYAENFNLLINEPKI